MTSVEVARSPKPEQVTDILILVEIHYNEFERKKGKYLSIL